MKTLAFIHSESTRTAVGDFAPVISVFSHYELGNSVSPFLLLDHIGPSYLQPTHLKKGVSEHPHRGFETVTIVYQGELAHQDTTGGGGMIGAGDVQWMTAGAGVLHEEVFSEAFSKTGGAFEMIQLWVNLPAKDKMNPARYQHLSHEAIPEVELAQAQGTVRVIAGAYENQTGPAQTHSPMTVLDVQLIAGTKTVLPALEGETTLLYIRRGRLQLNSGETVEAQQMAVMSNHGEHLEIQAIQDSAFLLLSGQPLNEPIYGRGYFVMNTFTEVLQAYEDLKQGHFIAPNTKPNATDET